ncbi:hypothetical protein [Burkholderia ubonensis]|uniref:hypothetical protein n=1 Tax=Burkholderia ubonensis TaxID=101571 RepID=UPI0012F78605|nr:hypothetical protein [Burkholderia ubonensis]
MRNQGGTSHPSDDLRGPGGRCGAAKRAAARRGQVAGEAAVSVAWAEPSTVVLVAVGGGRSIAVQPVEVRLVADVEHGGRASACMQFARQRAHLA